MYTKYFTSIDYDNIFFEIVKNVDWIVDINKISDFRNRFKVEQGAYYD
ncbi:MAG: hypothetical protein N2749_00605 [Clostridia bacterium]|nr:hypothetical protein [Clostridia bacterium]